MAPTDRPVPAGLQGEIRAFVLEKLASGEWATGERIPSETELTARFGASRMTVHHALKALSAEGWLRRVKGLGTFVAPPRGHVLQARLLDIRDEIQARGRAHAWTGIILGTIEILSSCALVGFIVFSIMNSPKR